MNKKNIILCADGTGNMGGASPDTNVYKTYNAVEIHDEEEPRQITFYDNGVGTSKNKIWRSLTGAFGIGFRENVCDLYEYLARHYVPGDDVFVFGFSRGAAEARAFSGFIAASGLIKREEGKEWTQDELKERIEEAFNHYKDNPENYAEPSEKSHGAIPIKFIGVWDTVPALGFPGPWEGPGVGMWILNKVCWLLDKISDHGKLAHNFYNYELTKNVENACHAIAINDERMSFQPKVYNENLPEAADTKIEQVWFAGMHSNVGGGYGRAGLANVALGWMMARAEAQGLRFNEAVVESVKRGENVHGRLYDSRDGLAVFYRYKPRDIEKLCREPRKPLNEPALKGQVRIHRSVLERLQRKSGNYAPVNIPHEFEVVDSKIESPAVPVKAAESKEKWETERSGIRSAIWCRQFLYVLLLEFTLVILGVAIYFWINGVEAAPVCGQLGWLMGHIATILNYVSPKMFENMVTMIVINNPIYFFGAVAFLLVLGILRKVFRNKGLEAREKVRSAVLSKLPEDFFEKG